MTATVPPAGACRDAGTTWLLRTAPAALTDPHRTWSQDRLVPLRTGTWLAAETRVTDTVRALARISARHRGPVLADPITCRAWWLITPDAADTLSDITALTVRPAGWLLDCPPAYGPCGGRLWLEAPDGTGQFTDPALLAAALGPGGPPSSSALPDTRRPAGETT